MISRRELGDQLETHLRGLAGTPAVTVYRGEVHGAPPTIRLAGGAEDASGRVAPYLVLFDGTGPTDLERGLAGVGDQLRWAPTITVAAGFSPDCVHTVDRVYAHVYGWTPSLPGVTAGPLEPPPGFDPGPPRPDRTVTPIRYSLSLSWRADLTA